MLINDIYNFFLTTDSVSTDSRKIVDNSLFISLKGDRFNGNEFAKSAIENGARSVSYTHLTLPTIYSV